MLVELRIGELREIGLSCGSNTTKLHMATAANGNPIHFEITGGAVHDSKGAGNLIRGIEAAQVIVGNKRYDS